MTWDEARALVIRELRDIGKDVSAASSDVRANAARLSAVDLALSSMTARVDALEKRAASAEARLEALDAPETGAVSRNRHRILNLRQAWKLEQPDDEDAPRFRAGAAKAGATGAGLGAGGVLVWQLAELIKSLMAGS